MSEDRLFKMTWKDPKTGEIREARCWSGWYYDANGERQRKSTKCTDRTAATRVLRGWERRAADPDAAAKAEARLKDAFDAHYAATLARVKAKNPTRSEDTLDFQEKQSKSWLLFAGIELLEDVRARRGHDR